VPVRLILSQPVDTCPLISLGSPTFIPGPLRFFFSSLTDFTPLQLQLSQQAFVDLPHKTHVWIASAFRTSAIRRQAHFLKLADGSITTTKIADNAIVTVKLADGAVTSAKILDGTVTAVDLATGAVTTIKIADGAITTVKIVDYAVTNLKLASYAIPFTSTYNTSPDATDSTLAWVDMAGMSVTLTLDRTSHILIMFSTEAYNSDPAYRILVRARIGVIDAFPGSIDLTPTVSAGLGAPYTHRHTIGYMAYSYNFYRPSVSAGTHTIKIQWMVSGGTGYVGSRTLTVIALPA